MLHSQRAAMLVLIVGMLSGCSRIDQVKRCSKLSKSVNAALDEIETMQKRDPQAPETYLSIAKRYSALAAEVKSLESDRNLAQPLNDYVGLLEGAARSSEALGRALKDDDKQKISGAAGELASITRREKFVVQRIEGVCHAG